MKDLYVDNGEKIPPNDPKPRGKPVQVNFLSILIMQEIGQLDNLKQGLFYIVIEHQQSGIPRVRIKSKFQRLGHNL